jgi:hypothetical protein
MARCCFIATSSICRRWEQRSCSASYQNSILNAGAPNSRKWSDVKQATASVIVRQSIPNAIILAACFLSTGNPVALSHCLVSSFHSNHFIAGSLVSIPPSTSSASNMIFRIRAAIGLFLRCSCCITAAESYWLKLPVSACPDTHTDHNHGARSLQRPPEEVGRKGTGVDCGDNEVKEMYGKSEVRDKFRA